MLKCKPEDRATILERAVLDVSGGTAVWSTRLQGRNESAGTALAQCIGSDPHCRKGSAVRTSVQYGVSQQVCQREAAPFDMLSSLAELRRVAGNSLSFLLQMQAFSSASTGVQGLHSRFSGQEHHPLHR
eukprot:TRINITY_DN16777_c0_g1_i1.p2 TRINITY_DN16777_c0_g1~~TRINITY_DN16777_c0_g1_i1.p2  ORF type:complete len:141 (-),score=4.21 TRINITY_DN16777_c0_g1_i1:168-554(-)